MTGDDDDVDFDGASEDLFFCFGRVSIAEFSFLFLRDTVEEEIRGFLVFGDCDLPSFSSSMDGVLAVPLLCRCRARIRADRLVMRVKSNVDSK